MIYIYAGYLIFMNLLELGLMIADKVRAVRNKWRIPEKVLLILGILGGAFGGWLGMYLMHHKTRHWYFVLLMPLMTAAYGALTWFLISGGYL